MPELNLNPHVTPNTNMKDFDHGFACGVRHAVKCIQIRVPSHIDNDHLTIELGRLLQLVQSYNTKKEA